MGKQELDNLVRIGGLKAEPPTRKEFDNMVASARLSLADAQNEDIATDSQFTLAYAAAHRLALAALRRHGYRSNNRRDVVFQTLTHTLGTSKADVQTFLKAHNERNLAEYEGRLEIDEKLPCRPHHRNKKVGGRGRRAHTSSGQAVKSGATPGIGNVRFARQKSWHMQAGACYL
jgi:hypothetical protein